MLFPNFSKGMARLNDCAFNGSMVYAYKMYSCQMDLPHVAYIC